MEQRTNFLAMWSTVRKVVKGSKQCWGRSDWIELNELCIRIGIKAVCLVLDEDDDECTYGITISKDDAPVTYTDHKLGFRALKVKDIDRRLSDWKRLINQGRLADPAVTNKKCSNAELSNLKVGDHVHRFVIKGRLQLLETTAMKHIQVILRGYLISIADQLVGIAIPTQ